MSLDRRRWLQALSALGIGSLSFQRCLASQAAVSNAVTREMVAEAAWITQLDLSEEQQEELVKSLQQQVDNQKQVRNMAIDADIPPAMVFRPHDLLIPSNDERSEASAKINASETNEKISVKTTATTSSPEKLHEENIAFASIAQLGQWLRNGKITSVDLTKLYLKRISRFDTVLQAVVHRLDDHALATAAEADRELSSGKDRGPLHGIPYGAKDLIAIPPWPTTWGAPAYRDQVRSQPATVAEKLQSAGAILIAKLSLGALAMGDEWFAGTTRNPWSPRQGSSGSSAGSASAVAAGLCGFAIGSETLGSIISPCRRCHVTGLRPTFGRVSRAGCMTLSWSMDKIGPIARTAEDCAVVLAAIMGHDPKDPSTYKSSFNYPFVNPVEKWRIAFVENQLTDGEQQCVETLRTAGAEIVNVKLPDRFPLGAMLTALDVECATSFDDLIRSDKTRGLGAWPNIFREGQFVPAVHYLRCSRLRTELVREAEAFYQGFDVMVGSDDLLLTNLTGHPSMIVTVGQMPATPHPKPWPVKLTARYWGEDRLTSLAAWLQQKIPQNPLIPVGFGGTT